MVPALEKVPGLDQATRAVLLQKEAGAGRNQRKTHLKTPSRERTAPPAPGAAAAVGSPPRAPSLWPSSAPSGESSARSTQQVRFLGRRTRPRVLQGRWEEEGRTREGKTREGEGRTTAPGGRGRTALRRGRGRGRDRGRGLVHSRVQTSHHLQSLNSRRRRHLRRRLRRQPHHRH